MAGRGMGAKGRGARLAVLKSLFEREGLRGEFVYRTLREAIIRGVLPEGQRVQDRLLALELGVSRTPVREALQRLESEGFLRNVPRLGLIVAEITPQDIEDIYMIRITLEGVAARLAAQRASGADIQMLKALNGQVADATRRRDVQRLTNLNQQFHEAIHRAARNAPLAELLNRLHYSVQRFKQSTLSIPERARDAHTEHVQLVEAIENRDAGRAEALARAHKEKAMRARLAMYHRQAAPVG